MTEHRLQITPWRVIQDPRSERDPIVRPSEVLEKKRQSEETRFSWFIIECIVTGIIIMVSFLLFKTHIDTFYSVCFPSVKTEWKKKMRLHNVHGFFHKKFTYLFRYKNRTVDLDQTEVTGTEENSYGEDIRNYEGVTRTIKVSILVKDSK